MIIDVHRKLRLLILAMALLLSLPSGLYAQGRTADNLDGTYTNPLLSADFPDPDVIRVGDTYYMVSTTMFIFPGVTILQSKDLVNWQYCSNAVPRFDFDKSYNLDGGNRYRHGQWATSLRYHEGKFYLLFITLNEGGFVCTADKAEGPWEIRKLPKGFYDPGLFFDEDGRIYVAHGYNELYITEVDKDLAPIGADSLVFTGDLQQGLEGSHVYKIGGYYYLYSTYGGPAGFQVALRSKNIYGPYVEKVVLRDTTPGVNYGVHQGALVETTTGEWWTVLFADSGPFGRFPSLHPVRWVDGWPVAGVNGHGVLRYKKPDVGSTYPSRQLPTSDDFDGPQLGMQWGWNHNPDSLHWSLVQRPGFLRLYTVKVVDSLPQAVNTLTQRIFAKQDWLAPTLATVKLDIQHMKEGDHAGLAVFQDPYGYIGIRKQGDKAYVIMVDNGRLVDSVPFEGHTIYLQASGSNQSREARFSYSQDGKAFKPLGTALHMAFSLKIFTGNKFCLFNYPTKSVGGYVDVDWFKTN